jgi:hypothetical protein
MALENRSEIGRRDEDSKQISPDESKNRIVINVVTGNVYVATGQSCIPAPSIQHHNIAAGNWEHLKKAVRDAGSEEPGLKLLSGGVNIGASVSQNLLIDDLKQYLGIN